MRVVGGEPAAGIGDRAVAVLSERPVPRELLDLLGHVMLDLLGHLIEGRGVVVPSCAHPLGRGVIVRVGRPRGVNGGERLGMRGVRAVAVLPERPAPRERPNLLGQRFVRRSVVARAGRFNRDERGGMRDVRIVTMLPEPPVPREPPDSRMGRRGVLVRAAPNRGERGTMIVR